ncbi:MFS transporter [Flavihumibacter sp. R14]|nr:MFS transporter [Flavihumibacter soli]
MTNFKKILPVIVITQFFCTSLWFAGNAVLPDIVQIFHLAPSFLAHLTSAVQFGFITGTLVFAVLAISDRFSPVKVFFFSSVVAALFNLLILYDGINLAGLLGSRFLTGFFLAGIYPVGMKIASDHYKEGLSKSLGFLVGALVVGTAFPHLLKSLTYDLPWRYVIVCTSALALAGGLIMLLLVPDGPHRKAGQQMRFTSVLRIFRNGNFRSAAFGYFGHMWELYAFWAFLPVMLTLYKQQHPATDLSIPFFSFLIIASGGLACVIGGLLSQKFGQRRIAAIALSLSGICCVVSPLFLFNAPLIPFLAFLFFWGLAVVADSPLFSTLVAHNAPGESRGSALTIVNCIGFSITIVSIQFLNAAANYVDAQYLYMLLAMGPAAGLAAMYTGVDHLRPSGTSASGGQ